MLPGAPLPNGPSCRNHLGQIIGVHLAAVSFRSRSILSRLHVLFGHSSLDAARDFFGDLGHAMQQHVAIAQQDAVMVMVGVAYFPEDLAVPVRFQDHAAFERKATEKILVGSAPVVKQSAALGEIAGQARRIWHGPGVNDLALKIDQIHTSVFLEMRSKECKPGERASRLASAQPNTTALERVLLYRGGLGLIAANGGACPEGRRAGKQRASLQFVAHHLTLSTSGFSQVYY